MISYGLNPDFPVQKTRVVFNKMKTVILTEGSSKIGIGHIMRCSSIYQALNYRGAEPLFVVNGDESVAGLLADYNSEVFDWLGERGRLFELLGATDACIIDSYLAPLELYQKIAEQVANPIYIDDNIRLDYPCGTVVNGTIFAKEMPYPDNPDVKYLLGSRYIPLRRAFWGAPEKSIGERVESIMLTLGGEDYRNLTPAIMQIIADTYPKIQKKIVVGASFSNRREIESIAGENDKLIYSPGAEEMRDMMLECDLAISAGGQTLYELARCGTPAIAVGVADNQINNLNNWQKAGFIEYAGWWVDNDLINNIKSNLNKLQSNEFRAEKSAIGRKYVDGKGAERIAQTF